MGLIFFSVDSNDANSNIVRAKQKLNFEMVWKKNNFSMNCWLLTFPLRLAKIMTEEILSFLQNVHPLFLFARREKSCRLGFRILAYGIAAQV